MFWYFISALFWASAALYIIGLAMGIFKYKHNETTIYYEDEQTTEEEAPPQRKLGNDYKETNRVNMDTMF